MRILVVEDEPLLAMLIEESLVELGHEVVASAATVEQALEAIDDRAIDLALLDFTLADEADAVPVAERLRDRGIPFGYLTGHRSLPLGMGVPKAPLITKPFTLDQLDGALREMKLAA
jgi:DNA-binding response OmpR family regulator